MWSPQGAHCSVLAIRGLEHEDSSTCGLGVGVPPTLIEIREPGENGGDDSCGERKNMYNKYV